MSFNIKYEGVLNQKMNIGIFSKWDIEAEKTNIN